MIYTSDLLTTNDMRTLLGKINTGLESIEFSISDNLDLLDSKIIEYRKKLDFLNVTNLTIHGPFLDLNPASYDSQIREVTFHRFSQSYEAALLLGAKKIIFHTCFIPTIYFPDEWPERMADFWNDFLKDRQQIPVLMENVYDPYPEPIRKVKDLVNASNFMLCLDIGHVNCYSKLSVLEWICCLDDAIDHVHLHDNDGTRDAHLALGEGSLPVHEVIEALKKAAPTATYTIECAAPQAVLDSYEMIRCRL